MLSVDEAITSRRSVRAYKPDPVPQETISHILEVASRAPSGTNMQPWHVHVFSGNGYRKIFVCLHTIHISRQLFVWIWKARRFE